MFDRIVAYNVPRSTLWIAEGTIAARIVRCRLVAASRGAKGYRIASKICFASRSFCRTLFSSSGEFQSG